MYHEVGLLCAFFACAGFLWAAVDPCWKKTSSDVDVQPYDICYGLWKTCTITYAEIWLCEPNLSGTPWDLDIPPRIHYNRSAVIISVILTSFAIFVGGTSSDLCRISSWDEKSRGRKRCIAGWMWLLSALLTAGGGAWWAHAILQERIWYKLTETPGIQYTVNRGIYIVWGAALLDMVAALCFTILSDNGCCNTGIQDEDSITYSREEIRPRRRLEPSKPELVTEYV